MSLNLAGLKSQLAENFASPGATAAACGQQWGDAMSAYASGIVPASTTVSAAAATLSTALTAAFATGSAIALMDTAFLAFAVTVGAGMAPAFVATPPAAPPSFGVVFAVLYPTHALAADAIGALIDVWMKTGTATPSGGGAPVLWS